MACRSPKVEPLHRIAAPDELPAARIAATTTADDSRLERVINTLREHATPITAFNWNTYATEHIKPRNEANHWQTHNTTDSRRHHLPTPTMAPSERELQISPMVQESLMHNSKVSPAPPHPAGPASQPADLLPQPQKVRNRSATPTTRPNPTRPILPRPPPPPPQKKDPTNPSLPLSRPSKTSTPSRPPSSAYQPAS